MWGHILYKVGQILPPSHPFAHTLMCHKVNVKKIGFNNIKNMNISFQNCTVFVETLINY